MRSPVFATKKSAYEEMLNWEDETVTKQYFCKQLHLFVKEKHPVILGIIINTIEMILTSDPNEFQAVDLKKFILAYSEHALCNVKAD